VRASCHWWRQFASFYSNDWTLNAAPSAVNLRRANPIKAHKFAVRLIYWLIQKGLITIMANIQYDINNFTGGCIRNLKGNIPYFPSLNYFP